MSKIDREKVLQWGRERLNQLKKKNDVMVTRDYVDGYIDAFEEWLRELQSGAFDVRETEPPTLKKFRIHWRYGRTEIIEGRTIGEAIRKVGIGPVDIQMLDYWEEVKEEDGHE